MAGGERDWEPGLPVEMGTFDVRFLWMPSRSYVAERERFRVERLLIDHKWESVDPRTGEVFDMARKEPGRWQHRRART